MIRTAAIILLATLFIAGCGYRFAGGADALPEDVRTLYVELLSNRTHEPYLENRITDALIAQFSRSGRFDLTEDRSVADAFLSGSVTSYSTVAISYDRNDEFADYRSSVTVSASLHSKDGKTLWRGNETWTEEYPASKDRLKQEDFEDAAIAIVAQRLAERFYYRVISGY